MLSLLVGLLGATAGPAASRPADAEAAPGLVGRWTFDAGSGTSATDSVGSRTATLSSGASWGTGVQGAAALVTNGTTGAAVTSSSVLDTSTSFTVAAHVRLTNVTGVQTLVAQDATQVSGFYLGLRGGRFSFNRPSNDSVSTSAQADSTTTVVAGQWYHVAGVYNASAKTLAVYVDDVLETTVAFTTGWNATGGLTIGRGRYNGGPVDWVNGTIDDVRVYDQALGAADLAHVGEAAHWTFDEGSGTSAGDETLDRTTATLTNGAAWTPGVVGASAASLDGSNDLVDAGAPVVDTSKSFSVTAWARASAVNAVDVLASVDGATRSAFTLQMGADGRWAFTRPSSDSSTALVTTMAASTTATAGAWYHLAAVYDSVGKTLSLYVNGTKQGFSASYTTGWKGTGNLLVGRGKSGGVAASAFGGAVDDVRVYPFVIPAGLVTSAAGTPVPPKPATPTATTSGTSVTLSWVAPAPVAASPTTSYVLTPYVNGTAGTALTVSSTVTSQTFTGLTLGSSYRYTVAAVNANGTSTPSDQSAAVVPSTAPGTPAAPTASAGTASATLTWSAPSANGSAITGYVVTPYVGSTAQTAQTFAGTATTQTVTGLTAGTAYTFRVAAKNAVGTGTASSASNAVTPNSTPTVTSTSPPAGLMGTAYSYQLTASGGTTPFTWSVGSGTLPAGLGLASSGLLSGTPTTAGTSAFTVKATDASGVAATQSLSITVTGRPGTVAAPTATAGLASAAVTWSVPGNNGGAITGYVVTPFVGGVAQPATTVDPFATTRTLTGLAAGSTYTFTVAAVNAYGTGPASAASNPVTPYAALGAPTITSVVPGTASARLTWTAPASTGGSPVAGYVVTPLIGGTAQTPQAFSGSATTQTLTGLAPGTAYTFRVAAQNSSGTTSLYRINAGGPAVTAGDGGPDWSADNGTDSPYYGSGTNTTSASPSAALDATVPAGTPAALFDTQRYDLAGGTNMLWQLPVTAGAAVKVRLYFANRYAGTSPVGSRVFDVALDGTTVLSSFDAVVAAGADQTATMREFSLTSDGSVDIGFTPKIENPMISAIEIIQTGVPVTGPPSSASSAVTPNASPTLTFAAPPAGEVNVAYSQQLAVTGGSSPFTWSVSSGTLPPGLTLGASSGVLAGTPTAAGTYALTVQVADAGGATATRNVTLVVAAQPSVAFTPAAGEVGVAYSQQPVLTGGTAPVTWSVSAGSLPGGLGISTSTGLVSGTPTAPGTFSVTLRAVDAFGQVATRTASIVVAATPTLTSVPPSARQGVDYGTFTFAAAGGTGPFGYAVVSGTLPTGLTLSTAGVLSGTPTTQGSFAFTVRAVDANGQPATDAVTLLVDEPAIRVVKTASATSVAPGGTVTFTVTATNLTSTAYAGTHVRDPLSDVLDDAGYGGDATVTVGSVSYASSTLDWAVPLNAGQSATLTYTVTVANPDTGNKVLTGVVDGTVSSTSCSAGQRTSACTATVTVSGLSVTTSGSPSSTTPGSTVTFSAVVRNTGQTAYPSTTVTQSLGGLLDDATYSGNASATAGAVAYTSGTLTWTGPLAVGASVTISYSVKVLDPDPGDRSLAVTALSGAPGSTCPTGSPATSCSAAVPVLVPALSISPAASVTSTTPGATVAYTVTLTNTGATAYTATSVTVDLRGVLDDATPTGGSATGGTLVDNAGTGTLVWTGDLAVGATVVISGSAVVADPDTGDKRLTLVASSAAAGSTCPVGGSSSTCRTVVPVLVPALSVTTSADAASTTPGSVVAYTVLVTDTGQTAHTGAVVRVAIGGVLDDATFDGTVHASSGTAAYAGGTITWSGDLAVGASATITYAVTVRDPDPGDLSLSSTATSSAPGSSCPSGGGGPGCASTVPVLVPSLTISTTNDAGGASTTPGARLRYTTTVVNTGQTTYTGVAVVLDARGLADETTYGGDGTESSGTVTPLPDGTLRWVLTLAPGQSATATASYRVNDPPTGDLVLTSSATSTAAGSTCPVASATASCTVTTTVLVPALTLSTTADATTVTPGDTIRYTVVATNTGQTAYTPAVVTDDLTAVLGDAVYGGDAAATGGAGTITYTAPTLTWSGNLAVGASVTITFTATVRDPDPGNKQVVNRVLSSAPGSSCVARSTDARCTATVAVAVPGLSIVATTGAATTVPGASVVSTVTVTNSGGTAYGAAAFTLPLDDVLDDAAVTGPVTASAGTAGVTGSTLAWSGTLAVGASATITYTVQVSAADAGDDRLLATVSSSSRGASCVAGGTDPRCTTNVPVARLVLTQTAAEETATPGSLVHLSTTWANTGQVPYTGISILSPRADTSDDTTPTGDQTTSSGTITRTAAAVVWTGDIAVGTTVTGTRTLAVNDPDQGNKIITATLSSTAPGADCPPQTTNPACTFSVTVLVPALTVTKTASTTATVAGGTVGYTVRIANTGETPYAAATVTDSLAGVLDDAGYDQDATVDVGSVGYTAPALVWTGDLAVGQTATLTYTVTATSPSSGDKTMVNTVTSDVAGSTCPTGTTAAACRSTVLVLTQRLVITASSSVLNATLGSSVSHTITVVNAGQTSYAAASFSDSLAGVLDDAGYGGDAELTGPGTVTYAGGVLGWTGALGPGGSASITYSVRINDPSSGDRQMSDTVVSTTTGSNCAPSSTDVRCTTTVEVTNAVTLTLTKTADVLVTTAGSVVRYTVTATNSSATEVSAANFTDPLTGVLDDATRDEDEVASSGTVTSTGSGLSWVGDVAAGQTVTVTYSVTVRTPTSGDQLLLGTLSSTSPATSNSCLAGSLDPRCTSTVPVAGLTLERHYSQTSTTPGSTVRLNATFTNTGAYPYHGISVSTLTADSNDDAVPTGDQVATSGTLVLSATTLTWAGDIPVGGVVHITGTLVIKNPDLGNRLLTATLASTAIGNSCPPGGGDPRCTSSLPVLVPGLTITKSADRVAAEPGDTVTYTVTLVDSGETEYPAATVTDDLSSVLDDADLVGTAAASGGALVLDGSTLRWTGRLTPGDTVTLDYAVRLRDDEPGDHELVNQVVSSDVGSTCPATSSDPACTSTVHELLPALRYVLETDRQTSVPGQVVTSRLLVTNEGETTYAGAEVHVDLADVLDDAGYDADAAVDGDGSVEVSGAVLTWTGSLAPGEQAVVSYGVTVDAVVGGNFRLTQSAATTAPHASCTSGTQDGCSTSVPVAGLHLMEAVSTTSVAPRGVVRFTETYVNVGQVPLYGVRVTIDGRAVFDDASYDGDATASTGSLTIDPTTGLLTWTGDLAVGQSATTTGSVTVDYPVPGDKLLRSRIATDDVPSNCPTGSTDPACETDVRVLTPALSIVTTPSTGTTTPGSTVGYTTTVTNAGETAYTGLSVTDDLRGVLDDTAGPQGVQADAGQVGVTGPLLTWTGDLALGASVTITFAVTVANPDPGDLTLVDAVSSDALGSSCPTGGTTSGCSGLVTVLIPALDVALTPTSTTTYPSGEVGYTLTVHNGGQVPYAGARVGVALAGVLDDATYAGDGSADQGTVTFAGSDLTWAGDLEVGQTVVVTFAVTVDDPDPGDRVLTSAVSSPAPGSTCTPDAPCVGSVVVQIPALSVSTTAGTGSASPGDQVHYTVRIENTGQRPYVGTVVTASLEGVLDDATFDGTVTSSSGVASYRAPEITWVGTLGVGDSATVGYTVTVRSPDPGDKAMASTVQATAAGSTCPTGSSSPLCTATVEVLVPSLAIDLSSDVATTVPGGRVGYAILLTNDGQTPYEGAVVAADLSGILTDADDDADAQVLDGDGALDVGSGVLTWTGDLAVGASVRITFSVTVHDPDTGDRQLLGVVSSEVPGSSCPPRSRATRCTSTVAVLLPGLQVSAAVDTAAVVAGGVARYTVSLTDTGETPYAPASATWSLAGLLDDARFGDDATATSGTVARTGDTLTWSGSLDPGESATITYSVTTDLPATGDRSLTTTVVSSSPGSTCPTGLEAGCATRTRVLVPALTIVKSASSTHVVPRGTVGYTVTATNTGEAAYAPATLVDSLAGVLDHATYRGDATATRGVVGVTDDTLTWSGPLPVGASVVLRYSVTVDATVDDPDAVLLNRVTSTSPGSTCPEGGSEAACTTSTAIDASTLELDGLTSGFTLAGPPGSTASLEDAVVGTVVTNSVGGYTVSVSTDDPVLTGATPGNADTIPIGALGVRQDRAGEDDQPYTPLSVGGSVPVVRSDHASAPQGDALSTDYEVQIPFVNSDTYSGDVEYIVATQ